MNDTKDMSVLVHLENIAGLLADSTAEWFCIYCCCDEALERLNTQIEPIGHLNDMLAPCKAKTDVRWIYHGLVPFSWIPSTRSLASPFILELATLALRLSEWQGSHRLSAPTLRAIQS